MGENESKNKNKNFKRIIMRMKLNENKDNFKVYGFAPVNGINQSYINT